MASNSCMQRVIAGLAVLMLSAACAAPVAPKSKRPATAGTKLGAPPARTTQGDADAALDRLRQLAGKRKKRSAPESYRIGPGDLIELSVLGEKELNRKLRISQSGRVSIPLIGTVNAAGRTEEQLASDIAAKLSREHLQDAQVDVFVAEYKSQQIAVTGAVGKPGLYSMTRERYTILDMLSEAGGLTKDAGAYIEFVPADAGGASTVFQQAETGALDTVSGSDAISISLSDLMRGSNRGLLNLPVVPGDVIFVPEAGSFAIEGWIEKPGTYPLTRGMTVLSALSTGGGTLFPARVSAVELLRTDASGTPRGVETVDVEEIREGKAKDVPLRAGDVVRVPANALLVPPWAFYTVLKELIRFGASVAVI